MTPLSLHTAETAPTESLPSIARAVNAYGRIPNLLAVMAESPELLEGYMALSTLFQASSFSPEEATVVWQTINVENECHYCVPAHTAIAESMKVGADITAALREQTTLPTARLEALRNFTLSMVRQRGSVDGADVQAFLDAGFSRRNVLEVILGLAQKVMSNYTNHLAQTPLDAQFEPFAWSPPIGKAAA